MNRHAWREVRRQIRESGGAGLIAVLLVMIATSLAGGLVITRSWIDRQLLPAERPATVVAVVEPERAVQAVWDGLRAQFPSVGGGPVSPSGVRDELTQWFPEFASLFSGLSPESFPSMLDLVVPIANEADVTSWLHARSEVRLVESSRRWQERLDRTVSRILALGLAVSLSLLVGCAALVLLVIRLLVLEHADEIAIMRLIGAHEKEIRLPYLICGTFFGLLGGCLGATLVATATLLARSTVPGLVAGPDVLSLLPLVGAVAGFAGALMGLSALPSEP